MVRLAALVSTKPQDDAPKPKMVGGVTGKGFMPGVSGNPSGRTKRRHITDALLQGATPERLQALQDTMWRAAAKGDLQAAMWIADRIEGKAVARQETGDPGSFEDLLSRVSVEDAKAITELADRARKAS